MALCDANGDDRRAAAGAPRLLAFDTSTESMAVGMQRGDAVVHAACEAGGAQASARLLPTIRSLLGRAGLGWSDLDAIAFGRGPGAFTGLRTACAVAQGIGLALGRPLVPIDSLLIVAEDARRQSMPGVASAAWTVGVAMDARMGEAYAAVYRWSPEDGRWQLLQPPALHTPAALAAAWRGFEFDAVAGSAPAALGTAVEWPAGALRVEVESDRAGALLRLAAAAVAAGEGVDAAEALPVYLRDKVAQTTAERAEVAAARAAGGAVAPAGGSAP